MRRLYEPQLAWGGNERTADMKGSTTVPLLRFAMIVKAPGYDPKDHNALLSSPAFTTRVVCVSSLEQARDAAAALVREGVQLIELCGGFAPEEADQLHAHIDHQVPVGVVRYAPEELEHLSVLFN